MGGGQGKTLQAPGDIKKEGTALSSRERGEGSPGTRFALPHHQTERMSQQPSFSFMTNTQMWKQNRKDVLG